MTVNPAANQNGSGQITITVRNQYNLTTSTSFNLNVTAVNDAPVVDQARVLALTGLLEDPVSNPGNTVIALLNGGAAVTDPDAGALFGMAVTGTSGGGIWQFSADAGVSWQAIGAVADDTALLLPAAYRVRFVPALNWNSGVGTAALTFHGWDQTSGTLGQRADISVSGGATAFGTATAATGITVTPVNDPPVVQNGALSLTEDTSASGTLIGSDVDSASLSFAVVAQPAKGVVTITDAATGAYLYTPNANAEGSDSFTFRATDGQDVSNTATINVTIAPVNDAPVMNQAQVLALTGLLEDPVSNPGNTVLALLNGGAALLDPDVGALPGVAVIGADAAAAGVWQWSADSGLSWQNLTGVNPASARLLNGSARVRFVPAPDWNGTAPPLTLRGWDQTSGSSGDLADTTTNGGATAFGSDTATTSVTVTPVNDAPVARDGTLNATEDAVATGSLLASDIDSANLTYTIVGQPEQGSVTITDPASGAYRYTPAANASGIDRLSFRVYDGQDFSNTAMVNLTIAPTNDPPAAWDVGGLLSFAGSDRLTVSSAPNLNQDLTVEAWINPNPLTADAVLVGKGGEFAVQLHDRDPNDGQVQVEFVQQGTAISYAPGEAAIPVGRWSHIAVTRSVTDQLIRLYINGNLVLRKSISGTPPADPSELMIGAGFSGLLDEVRVWNVVRSRTALAANTNAVVSSASPGLIGYWRFNEASGGTAADSAGGLDAAISGAGHVPSSKVVTGQNTAIGGRLALGDPEGDALTYRIATQPTKGQVTITNAGLGAFTYTPAAAAAGADSFTVIASDGQVDSTALTVQVSIEVINTPPTVSPIADQTIDEGVPSAPIALTIGDAQTDTATLLLTATSANQAILPDSGIALGGSGASRSLTLTPHGGTSGTSVVTVTVSDGTLSTQTSFSLRFTANNPPTIDAFADQNSAPDTTIGPLDFTIGDPETAAAALTLSADSSNVALVPLTNITFGGSGASRTLTIIPAAAQLGTSAITVYVSDGVNSSRARFLVNIGAAGAPPTITLLSDQTVNQDTPIGPLAFTIADPDTALASLTLAATSDNQALAPDTGLTVSGTGASRALSVALAQHASGTAHITVRVSDGTYSASSALTLTVNAVNLAPTISPLADQTIDQDNASGALVFTINDVETPAANLRLSAASTNTNLLDPAGIVFGGSGASRTVIITPRPYQTGQTQVTIGVSDGSLSASATFNVTVTPAGRATRTYGRVTITADSFTSIPGSGIVVASGDLLLGDHLALSSGSSVTIALSTNRIDGSGTITLRSGNLDLLRGAFSIAGASGVLTPGSGATTLPTSVAGFDTLPGLAIGRVDVLSGTSSGAATLHIHPPGVDTTAAASLTIAPGPTYGGTLAAFSLNAAGVRLDVPAGLAITQNRLAAAALTLTLPARLGGAATTLNQIVLTPTSLDLGSAAITLPNIVIGGGTKLRFTNNRATLSFVNGAYQFGIDSALALNLPSNVQSRSVTLTLRDDGGPQLSGTLDALALDLAGGRLSLTSLAVSNDGLAVASGQYALPASLGGSAIVSGISITDSGLSIASGTFALPDILIGSGTKVAVTGGRATLAIIDAAYTLSGNGVLSIRLPENNLNSALSFTIDGYGQLRATAGTLTLTLAGTSLQLNQITLTNTGLTTTNSTLTLPRSLGGASGLVDTVRVTDAGLDFGPASLSLPLPDIALGSKIALTRNRATLETTTDASGNPIYRLTDASQFNLNLPGNKTTGALNVTLVAAANSEAMLRGTLSALRLKIAGGTLDLQNLAVANDGFQIAQGTFSLAAAFGGSGTVSDIRISDAGLSIGGGSFALPTARIGASGKLTISGATASLTVDGDAYTLSAAGTLNLKIPENTQQIPLSFKFDGAGQLSATIGQIGLKLAGIKLALSQVALDDTALRAVNATLSLPASLGSATGTVAAVRIDDNGLSFGDAGFAITLPKLALGSRVAFDQNNARLAVDSGGTTYTLTLASQLLLKLPGNTQTVPIGFTMVSEGEDAQLAGTLAALDLKVAGGTLGLHDLAISRAGFRAGSATYALPTSLGGSASVTGVGITGEALTFDGGKISIPTITFGSSTSRVQLVQPSVALGISNDRYTVSGAGTLRLTLPGNTSPDGQLAFAISEDGQLSASLSNLVLKVAGADLSLTALAFDNTGMRTQQATLRMPAQYGSPQASVGGVSITKDGLRLATASIELNSSIRFGSQLSVDTPRLTLSILPNDYVLLAGGTLNVNLPGNKVSTPIVFQILGDGTFKGTVEKLDLKIAGAALNLRKLTITNDGLQVSAGSITIRGTAGTLNSIKIGGEGLSFAAGGIKFPSSIPLAGQKVVLLTPSVTFAAVSDGYEIRLGGDVQLNLPQNYTTLKNISVAIGTDGGLRGQLGALSLKLGALTVDVQNVRVESSGVVADRRQADIARQTWRRDR